MAAPASKSAQGDDNGGTPYILEEQIGYLLRRAHQRATALFMERIGRHGLTPTQFAALVKLSEHGMLGQRELGRLTAMDPATSLGVIRRLVAQGLVGRTADGGDRRRSQLTLTPAGHALVETVRSQGFDVSAATLAPLSADEQSLFVALLRKMM